MRNRLERTVCIILSFSLLVTAILLPGLSAEAATAKNPPVSTTLKLEDIVDDQGYLTDDGLMNLYRLPLQLERYTETEDNGDGSKQMRLYTSPIKYQQEDGRWVSVDNSIVQNKTDARSEHAYRNKANDFDLLISENLDQSNAVELRYLDYTIAFKPTNVLKQDGRSSAALSFVETAENDRSEAKDPE